jgi:PAS domain S-box-containing protein
MGLCQRLRFVNAILTDRAGNVVLAAGEKLGSGDHYRSLAAQVLQAGDVIEHDFHMDGPQGSVHLGYNLPLRPGPGAPPFGMLLLGIDPRDYLYPLIQSWPTNSPSAETLLVRRDGDEVTYLNDLRHRSGTALVLRTPLNRTGLPAVEAVLGKTGVIGGKDYRGVAVLAAVQPVPGTPWFLVAKVDAEEVYAPIRQRTLLLAIAVGALILAAGTGVAFFWRRQQVRFFKERYESENEHRALLGRYDYLSRYANDIILLMDQQGSILEANDRAAAAYGYSREELLKMNIRDLREPSTVADLEGQWASAQERDGYMFETVHIHRDGTAFPVEVSSRFVQAPGVDMRQHIIRDISERVTAARERKKLEQQLLQAQKMESIGRLAGGVAHDFNNQLTVILGYCDLLLARSDPAAFEQPWLSAIRTAGEQAAGLTRQLLAFSRKQVLQPRPLNLNGAIAEAQKLLGRVIGNDIELVTLLDPGLRSITADPIQMTQVIMNLTVNARDAMPGGGRIVIETSNVDLDQQYAAQHPDIQPGAYVMMAVSDTGMGMDAETQRHIFEPFFTTKGPGSGTGLGLSTVYGIVRQSGGWIWFYSEPGQGATFKLYFPQESGPEQAPAVSIQPKPMTNGTETVLVVEDQDTVRRVTTAILQGQGYRVLDAPGGAQALSASSDFPDRIDLLITDVAMPGMTGLELAQRLLALRPGIRVLYTSGYTANVIVHQGVLDPNVAYLPKPFTPEALASKVREVLEAPAAAL